MNKVIKSFFLLIVMICGATQPIQARFEWLTSCAQYCINHKKIVLPIIIFFGSICILYCSQNKIKNLVTFFCVKHKGVGIIAYTDGHNDHADTTTCTATNKFVWTAYEVEHFLVPKDMVLRPLYVKNDTGLTMTFFVKENCTVGQLKEGIKERYNYLVEQQTLLYSSQILDDNRMIESYNISPISTLSLVLRFPSPIVVH